MLRFFDFVSENYPSVARGRLGPRRVSQHLNRKRSFDGCEVSGNFHTAVSRMNTNRA